MPPITAKHIDPAIQQIRSQTAGHSDNVPFLLLPVRVETRFMEVFKQKDEGGTGRLTDALKDIVKLQSAFEQDARRFTIIQSIDTINAVTKGLASIQRNKISNIEEIRAVERSWLRDELADLSSVGTRFIKQSGTKRMNRLTKPKFDKAVKSFLSQIKRTQTLVAKLKVRQDREFGDGTELIKEMNRLATIARTISGPNPPHSKRGQKNKLVAYARGSIHELADFYNRDADYYNTVSSMNANQLTRIRKLHKEIVTGFNRAMPNLKSVHGDRFWSETVDNINQELLGPVRDRFSYFEEEVIGEFKEKVELHPLPATKIFYDGLKMLKGIRRFNSGDSKGFGQVNKFTKNILKKLDKSAINGQKLIQGDELQAREIEQIWSEIDQEAIKFRKRLATMRPTKPSHKFSLKKSVDHIDKLRKVKLNPFKNISAGEVNFVSDEDLAANTIAANRTLRKLENANKLLSRLNSPHARVSEDQKNALLGDLKAISVSLGNSKANTWVLGRDQKKKLEEGFLKAADQLKRSASLATDAGTLNLGAIGSELERRVEESVVLTAGEPVATEDFNRDAIFVGRFMREKQLWVRIFPDDIAIHTHEEKLTQQEVDDAQDYWKEIWIASGDRDLEVGAWRALCETHGSERAAYIAHALDPTKVDASNANKFKKKPDQSLINGQAHLEAFVQQLKNINQRDNAASIVEKLRRNTLANKMNKAFGQLKREDKVHEFLYHKLVNEIRKVQSRLTIVFDAIQRGRGSAAGTLQTMFTPIFQRFTQLQERVAEFEVLSADEFFAQTPVTFTYPTVQKKKEDWTIAPHCRVLPDRFVVLARRGGEYQHIKVGNRINQKLQVGLDPAKFEDEDVYTYAENGDLNVDPAIRWLTDYSASVDAGMGITLTLTPEDFDKGFDELIVLGVKNKRAADGKNLLEDLLNNHHFTPGGMEVLPLGTSTNNTEDEKSAYDPDNTDFDATYDVEMGDDLFAQGGNRRNAQEGKLLSEALGVDYSTFQHIEGTDGRYSSRPIQFHRALYPATMGFYLHEMFNNLIEDDDVDRIHNFMAANVSARGILPTLRVDAQPYGILATTAFSKFSTTGKFRQKLTKALKIMNTEWTKLRKEFVPYAYNGDEDPQQNFMNILGLQPTSSDYYFRYGANTFMSYSADINPEYSLSHPSKIAALFQGLPDPGKMDKDELESRLKKSAITTTRFKEQSRYTGVLAQQGRVTLDRTLDNNYFETLLGQNLYQMLDLDLLNENAMLALIARQSLLWSYSRVAMQILKMEDMISQFDRFKIGSPGYFDMPSSDEDRDKYITKWSFLFRSLNRLNGGFESLFDGGFDKGTSKSFYEHIVKSPDSALQNDAWTMAAYLNPQDASLRNSFGGNAGHNSALNKVNTIRSAMQFISQYPTAELDRLLSEHLDLCSYRLDAWMLGLANERLITQRKSARNGTLIGAWGYLEDLRKGGERAAMDLTTVPDSLKDSSSPIYTDEDNQGHIHMPSINHAITAAILRAGYNSNDDDADIDNQMAVNLSSARVRMALQLIEGVQNGQEIAAVLGYQLERGLHERYRDAEMDRFIHPLREEFPLQVPVEGTVNPDSNYNGNVVHGTDLLELIDTHLESREIDQNASLYEVLSENNFQDCPTVFKDIITDHGGTQARHLKILLQEIDRIADAFDALADLSLSESVYQISQGNHVRAGAVLQALAKGRNIPEPQIVKTPRTGTVLTQRVIQCFERVSSKDISSNSGRTNAQISTARENAKPQGWTAPLTPRALSEASINKYIGIMLGEGGNIRCIISYTVDDSTTSTEVTMNDLNIQPIDLLLMLGSEDEGGSELNKRIAFHVRNNATPKLALDVPLEISVAQRAESWSDNVRTLYEIMPMVQQLHTLLSNIRPAHADDLRLPPQQAVPVAAKQFEDVVELDLRTGDAEQLLTQLAASIDVAFSGIDDENLDEATFSPAQLSNFRSLLFEASDSGLPYMIPDSVAEETDEVGRDLARQLLVARAEITKREAKIQKHRDKFAAETVQDRKASHLVGILQEVFGKSFMVVPHFTLQNKGEIKAVKDLPAATSLLRHDTQAMDSWLQGIGNVRDKMYALEMSQMLFEVNEGSPGAAVPVQFPYRPETPEAPGDYWLGSEYPENYTPDEDKLSLVIYGIDTLLGTGNERVAVVWDEWLELIPNKEETTGVTFNYDQPDATPPQTMLLAVTPQITGKWDWDDLVDTIRETVELAKNRAVEPDHIEKSVFAGLLPAITSEVIPPNVPQEEHQMEPNTQVSMDFIEFNATNPTP